MEEKKPYVEPEKTKEEIRKEKWDLVGMIFVVVVTFVGFVWIGLNI